MIAYVLVQTPARGVFACDLVNGRYVCAACQIGNLGPLPSGGESCPTCGGEIRTICVPDVVENTRSRKKPQLALF